MSTNSTKKSTESKQIKTRKYVEGPTSTAAKNTQDEVSAKSRSHVTSTPRIYKQKSANDIYNSTKKVAITSKKPVNNVKSTSSVSLKAKPSNDREVSLKKSDVIKVVNTPRVKRIVSTNSTTNLSAKQSKEIRTAKDLPFVNVTVDSPTSRRKDGVKEKIIKGVNTQKDVKERQRQKTRTLDDNEVKILTPEAVDNNEEMKILTRKLNAKPKSFFIDLDEPKKVEQEKVVSKSSDEDFSYEDDFESYESDFESYHSEEKNNDVSEKTNDTTESDDEENVNNENIEIEISKTQNVDDEKMLDSGHFELNEAKKIDRFKPMDNIDEDVECKSLSDDVKKVSLTDEGFQEMSNSSGVSSMKIAHTDVLNREFFIDFQKSKEYKKKRQSLEKFRRRVKDLLSIVKLHEIPYVLFEVKPIPYDVYIAMFGRSNYEQKAVQTYDDGFSEEIQTEDIFFENKWTQMPVRFSKHEVYVNDETIERRNSKTILTEIDFFVRQKTETDENVKNESKIYRNNPLRILFDQKYGAESDRVLSDTKFEAKIKKIDFDPTKLRKFLKKNEGRIINMLCQNSGNQLGNDFGKISKWGFSKGYMTLLNKNNNGKILKHRRISKIVFSEQRSNLIITVHDKNPKALVGRKSLVCLWDVSVASAVPIKVLVAIDNIDLCIFRGNADGIFVSALVDGSIHLWDLEEEATWRDSSEKKKIVMHDSDDEIVTKSQTEIDREWNLKNNDVLEEDEDNFAYRACAYTSSVHSLKDGGEADSVVGLEFVPRNNSNGEVIRAKTVAQVCSLLRSGILTVWTILQEKSNNGDMGKAFWSKYKLQKTQSINLSNHIEIAVSESGDSMSQFNLTAAKKRILHRRSQKIKIVNLATPTVKDSDSSASVAGTPRKLEPELPDEKYSPQNWENGLLCTALKIMLLNDTEYYLIGKNYGEILCCTRNIGIVKVRRIAISNRSTTITTIEISPQNLPCFLVGTDTGNIQLCSINTPEGGIRSLLTLDCRSYSSKQEKEKIHSDYRGRFLGTTNEIRLPDFSDETFSAQMAVKSLVWLSDPCRLVALSTDGTLTLWDFSKSDIRATYCYASVASNISFTRKNEADDFMAVLTTEGDVEIHKMSTGQTDKSLELFKKYISLL